MRSLTNVTLAAIFVVPALAFAQPTPDGSMCVPSPLDLAGELCAALGGVFDAVPTEPNLCVDTPPSRTNPAHFKGEFTLAGDYTLTDDALTNKYKGVKIGNFGTTDVQLPTGGINNVRDQHYRLPDGKIGMRLIPVSDSGMVVSPEGEEVEGHEVMDDFLRKEMKIGASAPIYAMIAYLHPEEHNGTLRQLAKETVKTEMGQTHLGAYIGNGATRNSPEGYHNKKWAVGGYPATVQTVSLEGVHQSTFN